MIELVNSVADLTSLRDREELELIVVRVVADLLGAVKVRLWRPVDPLQPRWLAVMDVDYFKRVNDRFGHACGDDVLTLLARLMRESFRESDWLFRSGGEEFVVLLESTDGQYVRGILERFRSAVEAYRFPQVGSVTVSVGFTRVRASDDGASAFRRADEALYAAKRRGRNQMISDEEAAGSGLFSSEPLARDFVRLH
jgi:diguanylate cyclase (GGDEF)-like protein